MRRSAVGAGLAVTLAVIILIVGVLPSMLLTAQREALVGTPADDGLAYEDISLTTSDGVSIKGWWIPDATPAGIDDFTGDPIETQGVIIFVHGANSSRTDPYANAHGLFRLLTGLSHHVLAIDLRNSGDSGDWGGGKLDWGRAEALDVLAAVDYAHARSPDTPIIAFGVSMGGAAVINAAAADTRIRGLILLDPMLDTYDTMLNGTIAATGLQRALAHLTTTAAGLFHGAPAFGETALDRARSYGRPTLLLQDEKDPVNRRIHAERLAAANRNVDLWVAPDPGDAHPHVRAAGGWRTHVAAFQLYPDEVSALTEAFLTMVHAICDAEDLQADIDADAAAPDPQNAASPAIADQR